MAQLVTTKTHLLLALDDGNLLKIVGAGGTGHNMFAVKRDEDGAYDTVDHYRYLEGSQLFRGTLQALLHIPESEFGAVTLVGLRTSQGSRLLKIDDTGGTGHNMFALTPECDADPNYTRYCLGTQDFVHSITLLRYVSGHLLIGLADGQLIKMRGLGGNGPNMLGVRRAADGQYVGTTGNGPYLGTQMLAAAPLLAELVGDDLVICLRNKDVLRVAGLGGEGVHMFSLPDGQSSYETLPGHDKVCLGWQRLGSTATLLQPIPDGMLLGLSNGDILSIAGAGAAGPNMLDVNLSDGRHVRPLESSVCLATQHLHSQPTVLAYVRDVLFVGLDDGNLVKVRGYGGSGNNMLAISCKDGTISGADGYNYWIGTQRLPAPPRGVVAFGSEVLVLCSNAAANAAVLKIEGVGFDGQNMFRVRQANPRADFDSIGDSSCLRGSAMIDQGEPTGSIGRGTGDPPICHFFDVTGCTMPGCSCTKFRPSIHSIPNPTGFCCGHLAGMHTGSPVCK